MDHWKIFLFSTFLLLTSCTTLNDSIKLGSFLGASIGATTTSIAYQQAQIPSEKSTLTGATLGLATGTLLAYIIHKESKKERVSIHNEPELHFGDLPPNPFIFDKIRKKGN